MTGRSHKALSSDIACPTSFDQCVSLALCRLLIATLTLVLLFFVADFAHQMCRRPTLVLVTRA